MAFSLIPQAYAACEPGSGELNLADCLPLNRNGDLVSQVYTSPAVLVNLIIRNVFVISGIVLFGLLLYGGFLFISDTAKGKDQAIEMFTTAVTGFIILFGAYWVVQLIQLITGTNFGI